MKAKIGLMMVLMLGLLAVGALPGCEVGSPNNVTALANGDFSGQYAGTTNSALVANNSGSPVTTLTLNQSGNQLQALDNNGILFKGTIGDILGSSGSSTNSSSSSSMSATFTLNGLTTAGQTVTINGNLHASGTTATMTGLWIEPGLNSSINGTATIGK